MLHDLTASRQEVFADPYAGAVLHVLAEVDADFTTERQLEPVLDRLLETALEVSGADAGSIMLLSRERDALTVVAARGPRAATTTRVSRSRDSSMIDPASAPLTASAVSSKRSRTGSSWRSLVKAASTSTRVSRTAAARGSNLAKTSWREAVRSCSICAVVVIGSARLGMSLRAAIDISKSELLRDQRTG